MVVGILYIDIDLPFVQSLKGRRRVLNSMKEKLKKFNLGVIDLSGEYPKEGTLGIVFPAHTQLQASQIADRIEEFLYSHFPEVEFYFDREFL